MSNLNQRQFRMPSKLSMARENRDAMHADAAERGHDMVWTRPRVEGKLAPHYNGECRNCGGSANVGATWSDSSKVRDTRKGQCAGPGTKWQSDMQQDLSHTRMAEAVARYGQAVKDAHDRNWLVGQGLGEH